jgi:hypothetical protein
MKGVFFIVLSFLILSGIAYSSSIEVGINEVLKGSAISINYDNSSSLVKFSTEFFNTGSVGYSARAKLEVLNNDTLLFSGWSDEKSLAPGDRQKFDIYWYGNQTGQYQAGIKVYYGNEIMEYKKFNFTLSDVAEPKDAFEIYGFRTYDDLVVFDIFSREDVKNVTIIPSKYTYGWIFEQKQIDSMAKNTTRLVVMKYYPTMWSPSTADFSIVSDGGKFYTQRSLVMKKESGLSGMLLSVLDSLRIAFS